MPQTDCGSQQITFSEHALDLASNGWSGMDKADVWARCFLNQGAHKGIMRAAQDQCIGTACQQRLRVSLNQPAGLRPIEVATFYLLDQVMTSTSPA